MTVLGLVSVKHSPGVTTASVALAVATGDGALVVEADPCGGDIAPRARLAVEPGLLTMAAAGRHPGSELAVHTQTLPSGVVAVVAPTDPHLASTSIVAIGERLVASIRQSSNSFVDAGRWSPSSPSNAVLAACDVILVVSEPSVAGVEHVRCRLDAIRSLGPFTAVLLVGDRPYDPQEVSEILDVPTIGSIAVDARGAASVYIGPSSSARRSALGRSARSALDGVGSLTPAIERVIA